MREVGDQLSRMHMIGADDLGDGARFFAGDTDEFLPMEGEFTEIAVRAGLADSANSTLSGVLSA